MSLIDSLPHELTIDIFERACLSDLNGAHADHSLSHQLEHSHRRDRGPLYRTILSLCLVSRHFYALAVPLLYRNIFAGGRATLRRLARTLRARPELAVCAAHVLLSDRSRVSTRTNTGSTVASRATNASNNTQLVLGENTNASDNDVNSDAETLVNEDHEDSMEEDDVPPKFAFWFPRGREARLEQQARMQKWWDTRVHKLTEMRENMVAVAEAIAPSVRSLSLCLYMRYEYAGTELPSLNPLDSILGFTFPELRDLTIGASRNPFPRTAPGMPRLVRLQLAGGDEPGMYTALRRQASGPGMSSGLKHVRLVSPSCSDATLNAFEDAVLRPETQTVDIKSDPSSNPMLNDIGEEKSVYTDAEAPLSKHADGTGTQSVIHYHPALEATQLARIDVVDALIPTFVGVLGVPPILAELASLSLSSSSSSPRLDSVDNHAMQQEQKRRKEPLVRIMFGAPVPTLWREAYPLTALCDAWAHRASGGKCKCGCMDTTSSHKNSTSHHHHTTTTTTTTTTSCMGMVTGSLDQPGGSGSLVGALGDAGNLNLNAHAAVRKKNEVDWFEWD